MSFPKIETCIVCEAVRPELNNKTILLGFFGITPYAQIFIRDLSQPLSLCFVFSAGFGAAGMPKLELRLTDATGVIVTNRGNSPPIENASFVPEYPTNVFLAFQGVIKQTGKYSVELLVNGVSHFSTSVAIQPVSKPAPMIAPPLVH